MQKRVKTTTKLNQVSHFYELIILLKWFKTEIIDLHYMYTLATLERVADRYTFTFIILDYIVNNFATFKE